MIRTKTTIDFSEIPDVFHPLLIGADVYDSSCSKQARVIYIDCDGGYFLKRAPRASLEKEALLGRYFHKKGLTSSILEYLSFDEDWLLTEKIDGEDATHAMYLSDPKRLAQLSGELLRSLHELDFADCPVQNRMDEYFATVDENYKRKEYDLSYSDIKSADEAYRIAKAGQDYLVNDTLLHGDYCLPNFLLKDWKFSGFIDLGHGGVGDRHVDIFWGAWTLRFNLGTDDYRDRFFDAYGRDRINKDALLTISAAEVFG